MKSFCKNCWRWFDGYTLYNFNDFYVNHYLACCSFICIVTSRMYTCIILHTFSMKVRLIEPTRITSVKTNVI